jgi:hypothetical protein
VISVHNISSGWAVPHGHHALVQLRPAGMKCLMLHTRSASKEHDSWYQQELEENYADDGTLEQPQLAIASEQKNGENGLNSTALGMSDPKRD